MPDRETTAKLDRAARMLRKAGWHVIPPALRAEKVRDLGDQCQFPDLHGDPGDTCTDCTTRRRTLSDGTWMSLCDQHWDRPESELFDERTANV